MAAGNHRERTTKARLKRIANECVGVRLRVTNRVLTKIFDEGLRPFGLKMTQLNVLVAIGNLEAARPRDLCRLLELDASTLSRNVDRMVQQGWIASRATDDARSHLLSLTRAGERLVDDAFPAWQRAQEAVLERLGADGADALARVASSLTASE